MALGRLFFYILLYWGIVSCSVSRIDQDLIQFDQWLNARRILFSKVSPDPNDKNWVRSKLTHMVEIDQYTRDFLTEKESAYSDEERKDFRQRFFPKWRAVDQENTRDLKKLLEKYDWFRISDFGERADNDAWLLVQHADHDRDFQKLVLERLERLWKIGETAPPHYAYLFDRVAVSWGEPSERRPQRYGTQGKCSGPGEWEPVPIDDVANVDKRRAEVGLPPMSKYKEQFKEICTRAE